MVRFVGFAMIDFVFPRVPLDRPVVVVPNDNAVGSMLMSPVGPLETESRTWPTRSRRISWDLALSTRMRRARDLLFRSNAITAPAGVEQVLKAEHGVVEGQIVLRSHLLRHRCYEDILTFW